MAFTVARKEERGVLVLEITGDLDSRAAPEFEAAMLDCAAAADARLVVDFDGLDFISSAGLRVLIMVGRRLIAGAGSLALCSLNADVQEVLDISGMARQFEVHADRDSAFAWFESTGGITRIVALTEELLRRPTDRSASFNHSRLPRRGERIDLAAEILEP